MFIFQIITPVSSFSELVNDDYSFNIQTDKASVLDDAIQYLKALQTQVQVLDCWYEAEIYFEFPS